AAFAGAAFFAAGFAAAFAGAAFFAAGFAAAFAGAAFFAAGFAAAFAGAAFFAAGFAAAFAGAAAFFAAGFAAAFAGAAAFFAAGFAAAFAGAAAFFAAGFAGALAFFAPFFASASAMTSLLTDNRIGQHLSPSGGGRSVRDDARRAPGQEHLTTRGPDLQPLTPPGRRPERHTDSTRCPDAGSIRANHRWMVTTHNRTNEDSPAPRRDIRL
ncbi:MAG: hypothetical protein GY848_15950, partial [Methyloversatilis sp.]|nr:hypothetical protein [Methyloversatilis sp.]